MCIRDRYLTNQVIQGNMENVTPEAQGIGEEGIRFVKKRYGTTEGINEDSSPLYMRITEGLPQNYQNNNEIIVSALDGVSYRRFERPVINEGEVDSAVPTNAYLPKYGVELKYGLEDINYPSIWSELRPDRRVVDVFQSILQLYSILREIGIGWYC